MKLSIEISPQIKYQPMQTSLAYASQPWTAGTWMCSAIFWGWAPAVGTLVCSIFPCLSWKNSPDLFSGLWRLWVKAAGRYWSLYLHLSPKAFHIFSTSFYFPSSSYLTPEQVFPPFRCAVYSFREGACKREEESRSGQLRGNATVRGGWVLDPAARQQGAAEPPSSPQHSSGLLWVMSPIRTAPLMGRWAAWNQKKGPVLVF